MNNNGKRRAVVILHPAFDEPGAAGIEAAKEYAEQLIQGIKLAEMQARGPRGAEMKRYLKAFRHLVRNLRSEDL